MIDRKIRCRWAVCGVRKQGRFARGLALASTALGAWTLLCLSAPAVAADKGDARIKEASVAASASANTQPAHEVLFPALARMSAPPMPTGTTDEFLEIMLLTSDTTGFRPMERWASRAPQRAAIKALIEATNPETQNVIGIPYGTAGLSSEWIDADLYVDLGPQNLLADADFKYLTRLRWLAALASIEAESLCDRDKGEDAIDLLLSWLRLGRMLYERPFSDEHMAANWHMHNAAHKLRDIVYTHEDIFTPDMLADTILDLRERKFEILHIPFPVGDRLAAVQIVERTFIERGDIEVARFVSTMARLDATDRNLELFQTAAHWRTIAEVHAGWFDALDLADGIQGDYKMRFELSDLHDPLLDKNSDYKKLDPNEGALFKATLGGLKRLAPARLELLAEMAGTRGSLGVQAYKLDHGYVFPPELSSVAPKYANRRDIFDPYHQQPRTVRFLNLEFFVPIRDQTFGPREDPVPYRIKIVMADPDVSHGSLDMPMGIVMLAKKYNISLDPVALRKMLSGNTSGTESLSAFLDMPAPGPEVIDLATGTADYEALRAHINAWIDAYEWTNKDVEEFNALLTQLVETRPTAIPSIWGYREGMKQSLEKAGVTADPFRSFFGVGLLEIVDVVVAVTEGVFSSTELDRAINIAEKGKKVNRRQVRKVVKDLVKTIVKPHIMDPALDVTKRIRESPGAAMLDLGSLFGQSSFDVDVDNTQFVLYSIGENLFDDNARNVGPGGNDFLYWPPILGLMRDSRALQGE